MLPPCRRRRAAVFADTGDEPDAVYDNLNWLESLDGPRIVRRGLDTGLGDCIMEGFNGTGQGTGSPGRTTSR